MTKDELKKEAEKYAEQCYGWTNNDLALDVAEATYIVSAEPREKRIAELEKKLKAEQDLNAEIKARFVKCNTCTQDMKEKCLMFNENLCEGERCEELVDLMSLVSKRDTDDKLDEAKELIRKMLGDLDAWLEAYPDCEETAVLVREAKQFLEEV